MRTTTHVSREQFELRENEVIHRPTGATYTAYAGQPEPHLKNEKQLGSTLPSGENYRPYEVEEMARQLLRERLQKFSATTKSL